MSNTAEIVRNQQASEARLIVALVVGGDDRAFRMAEGLVRGRGLASEVAGRIAINNFLDREAGVPCGERRGACDGCVAARNHRYTGERPKVCGCLCHNETGEERSPI